MKWLFFIFVFFFYSCTAVETQDSADAYDYEEEEEEFLASEEEDSEELEALSSEEEESLTAQSEELEEQEAEDELKEIEDEFAEFADEEVANEEIASTPAQEEEAAEPTEELADQAPQEIASEETLAAEPLVEEEVSDISEEIAENTTEDIAEEQTTEDIAPIAEIEEQEVVQEEVADSSNIQVTNIRYENEQIHIDVSGGTPSYRSRFNEATRQFIIEIPNAVLMNNLRWPYIMKEFQSGFALLQADQKTENVVRIIVQMRPEQPAPLVAETDSGGFRISPSSSDNIANTGVAIEDSSPIDSGVEGEDLVLSEEEVSEDFPEDGKSPFLQAATIYDFLLKKKKFYGKPITLDVRDANLKDILYFLAEDSGINMIISDKIKDAKVNIQLKQIPWDQALFIIMKQNDLAYIREGNVVTIASIQDFEARQTKLDALKRQQESSAPLTLEIIPIAYAQAGQILSQLNIFKTARGNMQADSQNNALIIRDTEEAISRMKKLIEDLDRTPKQVMIAAKIVEAREDFSRNFGISWLIPGEPISPAIGIGALSGIEITPSPLLQALPGDPDVGTLGSSLTIGTFRGLGDLDARLGFAETNGHARVLSSPRIMALNGESASVNSSSESIAFTATLTEGGGNAQPQIQKSPLSLSLQVTPEITNVDSIYMRVSVNRSAEGQLVAQGESSARPISTRSAQTRILVKSGQTAVIGGIYETIESEDLQGIPFLKSIPVVSWLFSKKTKGKFKTELLLFLTPRIINVGAESTDLASHT